MRLRSILAALIAVPSLIACSAIVDDTGTSESAHTEGDPTFAQYAWQWSDETEDEFRKNAVNTSGWDGEPEFVAMDHPMTQRLQYWVDQLDTALRAAHPEALRATPKPHLIIRKSAEPNAWVSFMPVQWNVRTRHAGGAPDSGAPPTPDSDSGGGGAEGEGGAPVEAGAPAAPPPAGDFFLLNTGRVSSGEAKPFERAYDAEKLSQFIKFHNDGFAKCRLSLEGDVVVLGQDCKRYSNVSADRAEHLAYYATAKYVTITTGYLLELLDEDRVISTIAHELGHFYRSHATMPSDAVNYFYTLDDANHARKPAPDPRSLEQTLGVREKLRGEDSWNLDFSEENKLMTEKNLGFYTDEQEADEIALELMAKIGVPGGVMIDKLLVVQKANDGYTDTGVLKWAECAALRERGWRDEAGKPVSVPVGNLADAHHSICFRAFNVSREINAHHYVTAARPSPPGDEWSTILTRLGAELNPAPAPPPPAPPAPASDAGAGAADGG
jgi:Zn-dependent protease with chaperone function